MFDLLNRRNLHFQHNLLEPVLFVSTLVNSFFTDTVKCVPEHLHTKLDINGGRCDRSR